MNRMFLVCTHHPTQRDSYLIAGRNRRGYDNLIEDEDGYFSKWLIKHAACGGGFDHFTLAFERPKDHDVPIEKPLANAVHLELVMSEAKIRGPDLSHVVVETDADGPVEYGSGVRQKGPDHYLVQGARPVAIDNWRKGYTVRLRQADRLVNFDLGQYDIISDSWPIKLSAGEVWHGNDVPSHVTQPTADDPIVVATQP